MPFTLAHPAAVIPLRRPLGPLAVPSALVAGSLVPDFAYFLPLSVGRMESHSLMGLFSFCLPVGLVSYAIFHLLLAPVAHVLLPAPLGQRLPGTWALGHLPRRRVSAIAVSLLSGAATHLAWDSFTHRDGAVVRALPSLGAPLLSWQGATLYPCTILQHGSTLLGLGLLCAWGLRRLRESPAQEPGPSPPAGVRIFVWATLLVPPATVGLVQAFRHPAAESGVLRQLHQFVSLAVFSSGAVLMVSLLVVSALWRFTLAGRWRGA